MLEKQEITDASNVELMMGSDVTKLILELFMMASRYQEPARSARASVDAQLTFISRLALTCPDFAERFAEQLEEVGDVMGSVHQRRGVTWPQ